MPGVKRSRSCSNLTLLERQALQEQQEQPQPVINRSLSEYDMIKRRRKVQDTSLTSLLGTSPAIAPLAPTSTQIVPVTHHHHQHHHHHSVMVAAPKQDRPTTIDLMTSVPAKSYYIPTSALIEELEAISLDFWRDSRTLVPRLLGRPIEF